MHPSSAADGVMLKICRTDCNKSLLISVTYGACKNLAQALLMYLYDGGKRRAQILIKA
jgi:hypothetical protein